MANRRLTLTNWMATSSIWLVCLLEVSHQKGTGVDSGIDPRPLSCSDGMEFRLPEGLRVEKVAGMPLVERPIVATWDDQGRLLVLEAAGPVERAAEAAGARPHRLVRLVDENDDGIFDRRIVAAENLSFPVGVLARGNQVLVSAPPEIWLLTDEDGDGVCERREVWFNPGTATHCYNDLHGPYLGRDGWIYWTKGAFAAQSFTERDGEPLESTAAHIYRRRLEGGPIEIVMTGGMDNPVEVVFSLSGERFFTSTFLQHPAGGRRDGIAHAIYGALYGKDHDVLKGHWRTGDLMPVMTHLGPAAPSGLAWIESPALLSDIGLDRDSSGTKRDCLLAAQFNLQKVSLHRLIPEGSTFRTENVDLMSTDRIEFHPTDVLEDCDGSLLVFDTGGWYDLCCPSSAVDQSVAVGGIYRVTSEKTRKAIDRRKASPQPDDSVAAWRTVREGGAWIRQRAEDWMVEHPDLSFSELAGALRNSALPAEHRLRALWLLCRIGNERARETIVAALQADVDEVRQAAAAAIAVHKWPEEEALIAALRVEPTAPVQRSLAEALGRVGTRHSVAALMDCFQAGFSAGDRPLGHSLLYALVELNQSPAIAAYQNSASKEQWLAATRVLHERDDPRLSSERLVAIIADLTAPADLVAHASELLAEHPEFLMREPLLARDWYLAAGLRGAGSPDTLRVIEGWSREEPFQRLISQELANELAGVPAKNRPFVLSLLVHSQVEQFPESWTYGVARLLDSGRLSQEELGLLLKWLQRLSWTTGLAGELQQAVVRLARSNPELSAAALSCLPAGTLVDSALLERLVEAVEAGVEDDAQVLVWQALGRLTLPEEFALRLVETAPRWELERFASGVEVIAGSGSDAANQRLLELLSGLPLARAVPLENYRTWYRKRSEPIQRLAEELAAKFAEELEQEESQRWIKVDELLASLPANGDVNRGMQVFRSARSACASCHQVAYVGGQTGPDLSRIGSTRSRRELLEAIAFPSARQEQSYRSEKFALLDGRVVSGLVEEASGEWLTIRTGPEQRVKVRREEIEERAPGDVSLMPTGIIDALTPEQLADLLAFLETRK